MSKVKTQCCHCSGEGCLHCKNKGYIWMDEDIYIQEKKRGWIV